MKKKLLFLFFITQYLLVTNVCQAQFSPQEQKSIDSLNTILKNKNNHDTAMAHAYVALSDIFGVSNLDTIIPLCTKAKAIAEKSLAANPSTQTNKTFKTILSDALNHIGYVHSKQSDYTIALEYYHKSLKLQEEIGYKKGIANNYNDIGRVYKEQGKTPLALNYYQKSLKLEEEIGNKEGMATTYHNIGFIYNDQGDIPMALKYFYKSLKLEEELGDENGVAISLNTIGTIHKKQGDFPLALEYCQKSLKLAEKIGDKESMAYVYINIGGIYKSKNDFLLALEYYHKGLKLFEEIENKKGMAVSHNNLGAVYSNKGNTAMALEHLNKSLELQIETGNKRGTSFCLSNIGGLKLDQGNVAEAKKLGEKGLKLAQELGYPELIEVNAILLSKVYVKEGNYKLALEMRNLEVQMKDSLMAKENLKALVKQESKYEYEKQKALTDLEQSKKDAIALEEKEKQQIVIYAVIAGLIVVLFFLFLLFKRFKIIQKQKTIIELQKHVVDEKQKEILDSIHYAKRIQFAMLTSEEYISHHFKAEYFIFFQPKDVVSGDFYWATAQHNKFYICTADCTGHGVPGAFMSLLNISFLNENVNERGIQSPATVLNEQRKEIIKALNPNGNENSKDGMDCVLCAFDLQNNKLDFAAANNPLWIIRNKELTEHKADKMPVGKYEENAKDFTEKQIDLQKGDLIYTFTDGMPDQFGGSKGKKFMYKKLKDLLIENAHLSMDEQKKTIENTINTWKGNHEQVDDILVIGIRV